MIGRSAHPSSAARQSRAGAVGLCITAATGIVAPLVVEALVRLTAAGLSPGAAIAVVLTVATLIASACFFPWRKSHAGEASPACDTAETHESRPR